MTKDPDANYVDEVDDDFDVDESSAEAESEGEEEKRPRSKQTYRDPKKRQLQQKRAKVEQEENNKLEQQKTGELIDVVGEGGEPTEKKRRFYKKTVIAPSDRQVRVSTKLRTEEAKVVVAKKPRKKHTRKVYVMPTQEEILREAKKTERKNIESLHAIRQWEEEEKARRKVRGPELTGPRMQYYSSAAKGGKTILTFKVRKKERERGNRLKLIFFFSKGLRRCWCSSSCVCFFGW